MNEVADQETIDHIQSQLSGLATFIRTVGRIAKEHSDPDHYAKVFQRLTFFSDQLHEISEQLTNSFIDLYEENCEEVIK